MVGGSVVNDVVPGNAFVVTGSDVVTAIVVDTLLVDGS